MRGYRPKQAHELSIERQKPKHRPRIEVAVWNAVCERLLEDHSPEQVSGSLKKEDKFVSHERIYQYIQRDKKEGGLLYKHLRCQRKKKRRYAKPDHRGQIPNRVNISERPKIVEERTRLGDWEADIVETYKGGFVFVTLAERLSRLYLAFRVENKKAETVKNAIIHILIPLHEYVQTITFDNGKEFAYYEQIAEKLEAKTYFANPYHLWERGLNENSNGLLRQYFPKGKDASHFSDRQIAEIILKINNRPRKCLNFESHLKVFSDCINGVALAT